MAPAAIITGSDSGVGRATALALARDGFDVGITWHSDRGGAAETARRVCATGQRAYVRQLDLARSARVQEVIEDLAQALGRIDALCNNAAINPRAAVLDETLESWTNTLYVNLTGPLLCSQVAASWMIRQGEGGRIVNVTSVHEHIPLRHGGAYAAAKAGLGMLTKVMALELAEHSITVNSVAPGYLATPMNGFRGDDNGPAERAAIPVGRAGRPDEVAAMIVYLCSPSAAYVTGSSLTIDGGLSLTSVLALQVEVEAAG